MLETFQSIRTNARNNRQTILRFLESQFLYRYDGKAKKYPATFLCIFCARTENVTGEHLLPRWAFERHPNKYFITTINGLRHKYNQTTLPVCADCNNRLLSKVEVEILEFFSTNELPYNFFEVDQLYNIIRWMEILDYKFQVFSLMTRFRAIAKKGTIPVLSDYSLSVLDSNIAYSPTKAMKNLRQSFNRVSIKDKSDKLNSLVIFKTSNPEINFFHKNNDYLFLELPRYKIAVLYFLERLFPDKYSARDNAMEIIKEHY